MRAALKNIILSLLIILVFSTCNTKARYVDITGTVLDEETGQPVPGISVNASTLYGEQDPHDVSTTTDGAGNFSISHFRMSYPDGITKLFKTQKSSMLSFSISSPYYAYFNSTSYDVPKKQKTWNEKIYVTCITRGNFNFNISSGILFDKGTVYEKMGDGDYGAVHAFYGSSATNFNTYVVTGTKHPNYYITRLYYNSVLVKTKYDTITGLPCSTNFNYTINVN